MKEFRDYVREAIEKVRSAYRSIFAPPPLVERYHRDLERTVKWVWSTYGSLPIGLEEARKKAKKWGEFPEYWKEISDSVYREYGREIPDFGMEKTGFRLEADEIRFPGIYERSVYEFVKGLYN